MKKLIALLLALVMVLSMAACTPANNNETEGNNATEGNDATEGDNTKVETSAIEIMNNIWAKYTDPENTPFVMGGSMNAEGMPAGEGVPGVYDLTDAETAAGLTGILYIPEAELANIDDCATAMHAMMANNFTAGVVHVKGDATAFANTMSSTLSNNQWICGIPEILYVAVIGGEYVLMGFGAGDIMNGFISNVTAAYPDAQAVLNGNS